MRWRIGVQADPIEQHAWFTLAGLAELSHHGHVDLRYVFRRLPSEPGVWLEVEDRAADATFSVLVDARDYAITKSPSRHRLADVVWKRSFLAPEERKVLPFGFNLPCTSGHERVTSYLVPSLIAGVRSEPRRRRLRLKRAIASWMRLRDGSAYPKREEYESDPVEGRGYVVFQVHAWDPDAAEIESSSEREDRLQVNEQRAEIIRRCREEFGPIFVGGFVPSPTAIEQYPDLVSQRASDRDSYLEVVKKSDVGLASRGLHKSNPFKIPEYLAASRPIVTEELAFDVPSPLEERVNVITYQDPDGAVAACRHVLDSPELRHAMRVANHRYWLEEGRPATLIKKRLEASLAVLQDESGD